MKQWVIAGAVLAMGMTACGGGGGGSGSGSPPAASPPPANSAPSVTITSNAIGTDEGQVAWIDATASTDADDDTLTFEIRQTGGPAILPAPGEADIDVMASRIAFSVPEVAADTDLEFEVSVSDGTDTSTQSFSLTARNIELSPVTNLLGDQYTRFPDSAEDDNVLLGPMAGFTSVYGLLSLKDNVETGTGNIVTSLISRELLSDESFAEPERYDLDAPGASKRTMLSTTITRSSSGAILISVEDANEVFVLQWTGGAPAYAVSSKIPVEAPCAIASAYIEPATFRSGDLIIGQRGGGLAIYYNEGNDDSDTGRFDPPINLYGTGDFCFLSALSYGGFSAIDTSNGTLHVWDNEPLVGLTERPPINLEMTPDEQVVGYAATADNQGREVHAVIATTGEHDGTHRLIVLYRNSGATAEFTRSVRTWDKGIPSDVFIRDLDSPDVPASSDIIVSLLSAPFAVVVEDAGDIWGGLPFDFGPVTYAPLPLGISMFRPASLEHGIRRGFLAFDSFGTDAGSFFVDEGR